jgi:meiotic recombination protein DMC1
MQSSSSKSTAQTATVDEAISFRVITDLQGVGVNVADIKKLQEAGLATVGSVLQCSSRDLIAIKGLSEAKVEKIKEAARKIDTRGSLFKSGLEAKERRKSIVHVTTGSSALDKILGGGIETSSITELFGEFRTGKTQLAHTLCVTGQLSFSMNGGQGKVIYLDTEGNFRPERIESIAERFGLDTEETLDNIIICRVFSHEEQMGKTVLLYLDSLQFSYLFSSSVFVLDVVKPIAGLLSDLDQGPFRVLIIDSIIGECLCLFCLFVLTTLPKALFRVEYSGRGELSERQQKLGQHLSQLVKLAEEFNIAVVVINQCMADPVRILTLLHFFLFFFFSF